MTIQTKLDLRERILTLLRNHKEEERLIKSLSIKDKLFHISEIIQAKTILFYASFDGEVNTTEMIIQAQKSGKQVALPVSNAEHREIIPTLWKENEPLEEGAYGIKQPKDVVNNRLDLDQLDAVIVPGIAFDAHNNRLGRGAGYYDRFLAKLPASTFKAGLAFDFQCVDSIPDLTDHDIPVTAVIHN